jgi:hypothetical protein
MRISNNENFAKVKNKPFIDLAGAKGVQLRITGK